MWAGGGQVPSIHSTPLERATQRWGTPREALMLAGPSRGNGNELKFAGDQAALAAGNKGMPTPPAQFF
jgi:hypothetical protein